GAAGDSVPHRQGCLHPILGQDWGGECLDLAGGVPAGVGSHPFSSASLSKRHRPYEQAEPLYRQALPIYEEQWGLQHPYTANILNNLAVFYEHQGKHAEAESLYRQALDIFEQQVGLRHPNTIVVRGNYVRVLRRLGRDEEAARVEARGAGV
ncbi:MAG TPA: tetratricopeptide repeat protein, partial [Ktedonobacteraceae bacterium]|nr:tetratricopeptide repeat protein [Ktedonobacteraceae bacterium]